MNSWPPKDYGKAKKKDTRLDGEAATVVNYEAGWRRWPKVLLGAIRRQFST